MGEWSRGRGGWGMWCRGDGEVSSDLATGRRSGRYVAGLITNGPDSSSVIAGGQVVPSGDHPVDQQTSMGFKCADNGTGEKSRRRNCAVRNQIITGYSISRKKFSML